MPPADYIHIGTVLVVAIVVVIVIVVASIDDVLEIRKIRFPDHSLLASDCHNGSLRLPLILYCRAFGLPSSPLRLSLGVFERH